MDERFVAIEEKLSDLQKQVRLSNTALGCLVAAIANQPMIDAQRLSNDVSSALLQMELSKEQHPDGISESDRHGYSFLRDWLQSVLPKMPTG